MTVATLQVRSQLAGFCTLIQGVELVAAAQQQRERTQMARGRFDYWAPNIDRLHSQGVREPDTSLRWHRDGRRRCALERRIASELPSQTRAVAQRLYGDELAAMDIDAILASSTDNVDRALSIWTVRAARCKSIALEELEAPAFVGGMVSDVEFELARQRRDSAFHVAPIAAVMERAVRRAS